MNETITIVSRRMVRHYVMVLVAFDLGFSCVPEADTEGQRWQLVFSAPPEKVARVHEEARLSALQVIK